MSTDNIIAIVALIVTVILGFIYVMFAKPLGDYGNTLYANKRIRWMVSSIIVAFFNTVVPIGIIIWTYFKVPLGKDFVFTIA